jgi:hypothetical protein
MGPRNGDEGSNARCGRERIAARGIVGAWLDGRPLVDIAAESSLTVDEMLAVHATVITYELQTAIEQGIALLRKFCEASGQAVSTNVVEFPDHLRFGVPTPAGRILGGAIRHRRAAVALGTSRELAGPASVDRDDVFGRARELLVDTERWLPVLGSLVLENTIADLEQPSARTSISEPDVT